MTVLNSCRLGRDQQPVLRPHSQSPPRPEPHGSRGGSAAPVLTPISIPPVQVDALPLAELLFRREENPSAASPLTYRETAWVVPEGTSVDAAVRLALGMFEGVRASLADVAPGKLVNLAVFDHRFEGRPRRAPLATLTWKDWKDKGQGPEIRRPGDPPVSMAPRGPSLLPDAPAAMLGQVPPAPAVPSFPAPAVSSAPSVVPAPSVPPSPAVAIALVHPIQPTPAPPVAAPPAPPVAAPPAPPVAAPPAPPVALEPPAPSAPPPPVADARPHAPTPPPPPAVELAPAAAASPPPGSFPAVAPAAAPAPRTSSPSLADPFPAPATSPSLASSVPPPRSSTPSVPKVRLSGDELIVDLFEVMHDLHFLRDGIEGADFILSLLTEKLPSAVVLVHFYDIDAREFVVVRASGKGAKKVLSIRTSEKDPLIAEAMRKRRAVVIADAKDDPRTSRGRWALLDVATSLWPVRRSNKGGDFSGFSSWPIRVTVAPSKRGTGTRSLTSASSSPSSSRPAASCSTPIASEPRGNFEPWASEVRRSPTGRQRPGGTSRSSGSPPSSSGCSFSAA